MLTKVDAAADVSVADLMADMGRRARTAARRLAVTPSETKRAALLAMAEAVVAARDAILVANARDVDDALAGGLTPAMIDRLKLDADRIEGIAEGIRVVAGLEDPVGRTIAQWDRPNGLSISRVRTPLGVVGVIYESRPNVTADAGALAFMAGNAAILRGGSDSVRSSRAIHACLLEGLAQAGVSADAIQLVPTSDRAAVGEMLVGLDGAIDVIVPRGGKGLVARVQNEARVPVFAHLEGLCHLYIDGSADLDMAVRIAVNAKMRRTGICGAAETLLIDRAVRETHAAPILAALREAGCELRVDAELAGLVADAVPADEADWSTEYLDAVISARLVDGVAGAIDHIETYSSHHTEAIVAEDEQAVARFFAEIDSAILLHNASTQFADGGEFGMGAEIGIATGKMHARGPVGVEQLTSFKYEVRGTGQVRS